MTKHRKLVCSCCLFGLAIGLAGCTSDQTPDTTVDTVERKLETARHRRLLKLIASNPTPVDFSTDGCSGGLSAGWEQLSAQLPKFAARHGELPPWQECCIEHDRAYHNGAATAQTADASFTRRKTADLALKACVIDTGTQRSAELRELYNLSDQQVTAIYEAIAESMYRAVRVGGMPCTDEPWRWGYGWPHCGD